MHANIETWDVVRIADDAIVSTTHVSMEHAGPTCGACGHDPNDNAGAAAVMALAGLGLRVQITRVKE